MDTKLRLPQESREILQRARVCRACVVVAFVSLLTRLWYLQIVQGKEYEEKARGVRVRSIYLPAPRGLIYDRNGKTLVTSRSSYAVALVPGYLKGHHSETIPLLAHILNMGPEEIGAILEQDSGRPFDPVEIREGVAVATITRIEENRVRLPGVQIESAITRYYPHGRLAAHALGYIGEISQDELDSVDHGQWHAGDLFGKFGSESSFNEYLHGVRGAEQIEVDATGHPTRRLGEIPRIPGDTVMLTLDIDAQKAAEEGLNESGQEGSVVAMDAHTGDLLALASKPSFDPNVFSQKITAQAWRQLITDRRRPLIDRALSSKYPAGSTFKMVVASAALSAGVITPDSSVTCRGSYKLGRTFRCWKHGGHGVVNLYSAIAKSCDVYFYTVGRKLGQERLSQMSKEFGLGSPTGMDLPGELRGTVPTDAWKKKYFGERWYPGDTLNMAIGQGFLQVTPIQMACVTAVVANGGTRVRPHLLKKILSSDGKVVKLPSTDGRPVHVSPQALLEVRRGMRQAVLAGTAPILKMTDLSVAAKTGSAEDVHSPTPHAWIVSFAPCENPQIVVVVCLENAGHGGTEAGPIAKRVLQALFKSNRTSKTPARVAVAHENLH